MTRLVFGKIVTGAIFRHAKNSTCHYFSCLFFLVLPAGDDVRPPKYAVRWDPPVPIRGEDAPEPVDLRSGTLHALRFVRDQADRLDLGQGAEGALRIRGALTLLAVFRFEDIPREKTALISKWRLTRDGRSYELGITPSRQLFFTISASGTWPDRAIELMSDRPLRPGVLYAAAAVFEPGKRMALHLNGIASGEVTGGCSRRNLRQRDPGPPGQSTRGRGALRTGRVSRSRGDS